MDLFRFLFCMLALFTPALSFDDFARDSLSPHTRLGRQKHHTAPSVKFISVPLPSRTALVLFAHTSSSGTIVARSPQAAHTRLCAALYRTSKRDSASVAIYFLHCIITPNGAISKRLHFILLVPCSISAFQSDYMVAIEPRPRSGATAIWLDLPTLNKTKYLKNLQRSGDISRTIHFFCARGGE
ncbi:hypothetical protein C8J57DRAFT_1399455, partial [Mycena rebaudengoi]